MKGGIVYKFDSYRIALEVLEFLKSIGFQAEIIENWSDACMYDFIVVVGGDGTILKLLQFLKECPPIFGINTGRIGLLTHCEPDEYREKLRKALTRFEVERFMRLESTVENQELLSLNEIAVLGARPAKLIDVEVFIDDVRVDEIRCDGILVSTQIGSTAYALSTGGPVIDPKLESILIVPVAPFKLGWKPWVVKSDKRIRIEFDREVFVVADGHKTIKTDRSPILIKKSKYYAYFFKMEDRMERIVKKLRSIR